MYNFENKRCNNGEGIHYSRIIASWVVANEQRGFLFEGDYFKDWLRSLELPEEEVSDIYEMATNGRLECENHARKYLSNK